MLMIVVPFPNPLVAVIVWFVATCVLVGVPLTTHVVLFMDRPVGKAGDDVQDVGVFPVNVGVKLEIEVFCV